MSREYDNIIVGTDGSATARCAVSVATALASATGTPLHIATAWKRDAAEHASREEAAHFGDSEARERAIWAAEVVSDASAIARSAGVEAVSQDTPVGSPADALVHLGEQLGNALIVVGTVGLDSPAERLLGNVPHQLTHHAHDDVFLVRRQACELPLSWGTVALATDGSATASVAVERGLRLARQLGATPVLLTVARNRERGEQVLTEALAHLDDPAGIELAVADASDPAQGLLDAGASYDLLVVGNKGMSGPSRLLGSVSNRVTHHVPTDLLLVNTTR